MSKEKLKIDFLVISPSGKLMEEGPVFKSDDFSQPDIECHSCGYLIAQGIKYDQIRSVLNYCPKCGSLYQHPE